MTENNISLTNYLNELKKIDNDLTLKGYLKTKSRTMSVKSFFLKEYNKKLLILRDEMKSIYLFRKILDLCINLKKDKMKNLIYLIIVTPILFSCNTDKAVDLVQAKAEAEAFIDTQFDFFSSGSLKKQRKLLPWMLSL